MRNWYQKTVRRYDWACARGSAEKAVFLQLLEGETLDNEDGPTPIAKITCLIDFVKCFERVRLHHVWVWGVRHQTPKRLLRMLLRTFSLPRRLKVNGSLSEELENVSAIVAGSVFALGVLHASRYDA